MAMTLSGKRGQQSNLSTLQASQGQAEGRLEGLFQEYWERLCASVYRIVGDWDEAQDLTLETFVQLHQNPPPREQNLGGWLYRVATNLGLNALRARKRRQQYEEHAGSLLLEDNAPLEPAAALEKKLEQEDVRRVLHVMKPRSAQLLILRHSGLTYAEIAAALNITPTSVGSLLARAEREFEENYEETSDHRPPGTDA